MLPQTFEADAKSLVQSPLIALESRLLKNIISEKNKDKGFSHREELDYLHDGHGCHVKVKVFVGASFGYVSNTPQNSINGFGYDPIFYSYRDPRQSYAELSVGEKNQISHRGRALEGLRNYLASVP